MKSCPAPGCGADVEEHRFCCPRHWTQMPQIMRLRLTDAFYRMRTEKIDPSDLRQVQADVCRALRWEPPDQGVHLAGAPCPHCGRVCFTLTVEGTKELATFEEVDADAVPPSKAWHVIGGTARPRRGHRGSYTWFQEHRCGAPSLSAAVEAARGGPAPTPFRGYA